MPKVIAELVRSALTSAQNEGELPAFEVDDLGIERPADMSHGEWTSTIALRSAKLAKMAPRAIAEVLVAHLPRHAMVESVEIAGPGFINFHLSPAACTEVFNEVRSAGFDYARSQMGENKIIQVEFVSANPVGPLHVGHGRWSALGDSLCRVFEHAGYRPEREFYINDRGSQMDVFGESVSLRYVQLATLMREQGLSLDEAADSLEKDRQAYVEDEEDAAPETHPFMDDFIKKLGGNAYGGDYIITLARDFYTQDGDRWMDVDAHERMAEFRERGYQCMLESVRATCHDVRNDFDVWFSERSLYEPDETGTTQVERSFARLDKMGYLYKKDGALWFRSTALGDDKDRPLIKANGEYTYFASDVAYHWDKLQRVDYIIDLLGCDHHGYIARLAAVCAAFGRPDDFEVLLGQFVNLLRNGEPMRMSKRKGVMVTFRELIDEVGPDAVRYTLISRSSTQPIDFDVEAVKCQKSSNPVYYVQYAHARICSILRRAVGAEADEADTLDMDDVAERAVGKDPNLSLLTTQSELLLARKLVELPELIESCARDRAPFRLTHYLEELAGLFHGFYTECQVISSKTRPLDAELSRARLAACDATRIVLALCLHLIGVSAPKRM